MVAPVAKASARGSDRRVIRAVATRRAAAVRVMGTRWAIQAAALNAPSAAWSPAASNAATARTSSAASTSTAAPNSMTRAARAGVDQSARDSAQRAAKLSAIPASAGSVTKSDEANIVRSVTRGVRPCMKAGEPRRIRRDRRHLGTRSLTISLRTRATRFGRRRIVELISRSCSLRSRAARATGAPRGSWSSGGAWCLLGRPLRSRAARGL